MIVAWVDRLDVADLCRLRVLVSFDDAAFGLRLLSSRLADKADVMTKADVVLLGACSPEEPAEMFVAWLSPVCGWH